MNKAKGIELVDVLSKLHLVSDILLEVRVQCKELGLPGAEQNMKELADEVSLNIDELDDMLRLEEHGIQKV